MIDRATQPLADMRPRAGPVLFYDGGCPICTYEVARLRRWTSDRIATETLQSASVTGEIPGEMKLLVRSGQLLGGMNAFVRALGQQRWYWWVLWIYYVPVIRQVADAAYRWVAANRYRLSGLDCPAGSCGLHPESGAAAHGWGTATPVSFRRSAKLVLVILALAHLAAFAGLWPQVLPLIGADGLLPAADAVAQFAEARAGAPDDSAPGWLNFPTIFALTGASDALLRGGIVAGVILAGLALFGLLRRTCFALLLILYVSYVTVGGAFFGFQWDGLLIEMTLHALLLPSYSRLLTGSADRQAGLAGRRPSAIAVFLMQWLLFRVYFESGIAKVLALGGGWTDLSAMGAYYDTAPLATWIGWHFHHLPAWWHQLECVLVLVIEIILPVFIFVRSRFRIVIFAVFTAFQCLILLTANYGLFNYLTIALGLFLLEDRDYELICAPARRAWQRLRPTPIPRPRFVPPFSVGGWAARTAVLACVALVILTASTVEMLRLWTDRSTQRELFSQPPTAAWLGRFRDIYGGPRLVNRYHLFASMTRTRDLPEIEGQDAAGTWHTYAYRWAPAAVDRAPPILAPYHPRLDFQIWFVTLSRQPGRQAFFVRLLEKLCTDGQAAERYFGADPLDGACPQRIRVRRVRYRMADPAERATSGVWWQREPREMLLGPVTCSIWQNAADQQPDRPASTDAP